MSDDPQSVALPDDPVLHWTENNQDYSARWHSENGIRPPKRVIVADDTLAADTAFRLASEGVGILWRGDFQNAKQLLQALARRLDRPAKKAARSTQAKTQAAIAMPQAFHLHRQAQSQRSRTLGMLLITFNADHSIPLRRAPDVRQACLEAMGESATPYVASLRELLGIIGAHEWRKNGIPIAALNGRRIHAHYGVFAPLRTDYIPLLAEAPLPEALDPLSLAFDIGTGTGVLAAVLAMRGIKKIIATDQDARALACARENIARLDMVDQVEVIKADLFPTGQAALVVCNPPWVPARPSSSLEYAVFDPESRMLQTFLSGLAAHLTQGGEGWLILSDLAEHLQLRSREALLAMFEAGGLKVVGRMDARPTHQKVSDQRDALHAIRSKEVTSLWRLAKI